MIFAALQIDTAADKRIPLKKAEQTAKKILSLIQKIEMVKIASIAGSIRRRKPTIGDIDIIVGADIVSHKAIMEFFTHLPLIKRVLLKGATKASVLLQDNIQVDIRVVRVDDYPSALLYFTGSKDHNVRLRSLAKRKGLKLNEYGVFSIKSGKRISIQSEEEIYKLMDLPYIKPERRIGGGEFNTVP